jgi:hypothetical protein
MQFYMVSEPRGLEFKTRLAQYEIKNIAAHFRSTFRPEEATREDVLPSLFHQIGLLVALARACSSTVFPVTASARFFSRGLPGRRSREEDPSILGDARSLPSHAVVAQVGGSRGQGVLWARVGRRARDAAAGPEQPLIGGPAMADGEDRTAILYRIHHYDDAGHVLPLYSACILSPHNLTVIKCN